jgi:hypothetical protein
MNKEPNLITVLCAILIGTVIAYFIAFVILKN